MSATVYLAPDPILQFFDNSGNPAAGGSVLTQVASVNYPTYQDSGGNTPLPNPIPLNSRGEISNSSGISSQLFLVANQVYTFTLYDVSGNQLNQSTYVAAPTSSTAAGELVSVLNYGAAGTRAAINAAILAIGSTKCILWFPSSAAGNTTWNITTALDIPSNITLNVERGNIFNITKNVTMTIDAEVQAGRYQIFSFDPTYTFTTAGGFLMPVSFTNGGTAYPEWFGATGNDATHDDRPGLQAVADSFAAPGTVDNDSISYYILSVGRTNYVGETCGLYLNNDTNVNARNTAVITWRFKGVYSTIFYCKNSLGLINMISCHFQNSGGNMLGGFTASVTLDSGSRGTTCVEFVGCNGLTYDPIATGGGIVGTMLYSCTPFVSSGPSYDEFSLDGILAIQCSGITLFSPAAFEGAATGSQLTIINSTTTYTRNGRSYVAQAALPNNQQYGPIVVLAPQASNTLTEYTGLTVDIDPATEISLQIIGTASGTNALDSTQQGGYDIVVVQCYTLTMVGGMLWHTKYGCAFGNGFYSFVGVDLTKIGIYDQSTPWAVKALYFSGTVSEVVVTDCTFNNIAGNAIVSKAKVTKVRGNKFINCANGGLNSSQNYVNTANATCGVEFVKILPQSTDTIIDVTGNFWGSSFSSGLTALSIDCSTAIPAAGNVTIAQNKMAPGAIATPFAHTGADSAHVNTWFIHQDQLAADTPYLCPSSADANAPDSSLYYSTDASKLVWKDSGGVVHSLY